MHSTRTLAASALGVALLLSTSAFAQTTNTRLLGRLDEHGYYNDVWGYSGGGKEIAILGTDTGTAFIDATDPTNPDEVAFIPGPNSIWRDMDTWGNHAYIVTEGGAGIQIVDLGNPLAPTLVKTCCTALIDHAHTIYIDKTAGVLYANGTGFGMRVFSLADPLNPALITTYTPSYVHDSFAQNGLALLSLISSGQLRLVDVSALPAVTQLDSIATPRNATHNAWANASNTLAITSDETGGGALAVYDISDPTDVRLLSQYTTGTGSIIHNAYFLGNYALCSWYTDGFVAVDLSNPAAPRKFASYDTYAGPSGGFNGAWSIYPYQPSGVVYISDQQTGLYVVEIECYPPLHYGNGLAGSGGFVPRISAHDYAAIGNASFGFVGTQLLGGARGVFVVGFGRASQPFYGGTLLVSLNPGYFRVPFTASGSGPGAGTASATTPLPNNLSLVGTVFDTQLFAFDPAAPRGISMSDAIEMEVCNPN
jgi:choice-of-anchor B domain-containing protein